MPNLDRMLLFEQLDSFRVQRHDFLNNFQVIRGYLQLNMPDKAVEYIDEVIQELKPQQDIYKIPQKTLIAVLLGWFFGLRFKGIKARLSFPQEMREQEFWSAHWQEEYARQFYGYTKECLNDVPTEEDPDKLLADIELKPERKGFSCEYRLYKKNELYFKKTFLTSD